MLVDNTFGLVDDPCALLHQVLPKVGELPNLGIFGISRKNPADLVRTLSPLEQLAVIPEECAKGIGIAFVGLVQSGLLGLNDDDFGASGLLELFEQPIVKAANFDDCHEAAMFASLFGEGNEKLVNVGMFGTDLSFLHDFSLFVSGIDGQMVFVLVDSKIQHGGSTWG